MEERIAGLLRNWKRRNICGFFVPDKEQALAKLLEIVPVSCSVGLCGSQTLEELGAARRLEAAGNKVFNQYKPGLSPQESRRLREQGARADYYLTSANAVSQEGELVFFSAWGQRISGIANAPAVVVVCGINKLTADLGEALKRSREHAAVLNVKRLGWKTPCFSGGICRQEDCFAPDYKRMCSQLLILESELDPQRLKVILVGEALGF